MFDRKNAKTAEKPKAKKGAKAEHVIDGVRDYAAIDIVIKALETLKATGATEIKATALVMFVSEITETGVKSESFKAIDEGASAGMQLRQRSSKSSLSADEQAILNEAGIPFGEEVDVEERFVINPEYMNDQALLAKVEKAIKTIKGFPVADFIQLQEKKSRAVATKQSIDAVCALRDADKIAALLPVVTTQAISQVILEDDSIKNAFAVVKKALGI